MGEKDYMPSYYCEVPNSCAVRNNSVSSGKIIQINSCVRRNNSVVWKIQELPRTFYGAACEPSIT